MTRPPEATPAGPGQGRGPGRPAGGFQVAGFTVRLTLGAYLLGMLAVLVSAFLLPAVAPGQPTIAYLAATAALVTGFLGSLVAHELAHAIVARRQGAGTGEIRIGFVGGTVHGRHEYRTARALARVAAAGPVASLSLAAISAGAAAGVAALGGGRLIVLAFAALTWINALLTVVNMLPGAGLDGGRIVHALAWARSGDRARAAVTAARIGQFTGALLIAGGVALFVLGYFDGIWAGLIGLLMVSASRAQAREVLTITAMAGLRVRDVLPGSVMVIPGWRTVQAFLDGQVDDTGAAETERPGASGTGAYPVRDFDGRPAGVLTLSQLGAVPAGRRATLRVSDVATPVRDVVTTTPDEPLSRLVSRLSIRPSTPAALHTLGHALVLGEDGSALGVLTPADFARASQLGRLHAGRPAP